MNTLIRNIFPAKTSKTATIGITALYPVSKSGMQSYRCCFSPQRQQVFQKIEQKKEVENDLLSCVAPLTAGSCNLFCENFSTYPF